MGICKIINDFIKANSEGNNITCNSNNKDNLLVGKF